METRRDKVDNLIKLIWIHFTRQERLLIFHGPRRFAPAGEVNLLMGNRIDPTDAVWEFLTFDELKLEGGERYERVIDIYDSTADNHYPRQVVVFKRKGNNTSCEEDFHYSITDNVLSWDNEKALERLKTIVKTNLQIDKSREIEALHARMKSKLSNMQRLQEEYNEIALKLAKLTEESKNE